MTETFNLAFFTNTNDKIYIMSMRGVKVDIEEDLLAVTPHGIAGYKKGGEVYNYLHSNFGDEKRLASPFMGFSTWFLVVK